MMKYDVFVSFRGEQTRKTFLSHLLISLKKKDITTFTSSESSSHMSLYESRVAIPVISKDQASLDLWVDDLGNIIECEKKGTLTAVPIFLQLDTYDILKMLRTAGKSSQSMQQPQRKNLEIVKKWLDAHVINKTGFHSTQCKDDSELVGKVTTFVFDILTSSTSRYHQTSPGLSPTRSLKLSSTSRYHQTSPGLSPTRSLKLSSTSRYHQTSPGLSPTRSLKLSVRLDPILKKEEPSLWRLKDNTNIRRSFCVADLRALLMRAESGLTGICGIEGVGKTSLVRNVYDEISPQFQYHFFITNRIRPQHNSYIPNSLIIDLAREAAEGSSFHGRSDDDIKEMLRHQKVLIVSDGVDDIKQLKGIIQDATWFGPGSRVIVITQDRSLLTQCGVKHIYEVECPKYEEALSFFSEFAFRQRNPFPGFEELSFRAVQVSNRLPIALKMLGSFLCDKGKDEWISTLRRLEASHNNYATEVCRYIGGNEYVPRRSMKVDQHIKVDESIRFPFYRFALK